MHRTLILGCIAIASSAASAQFTLQTSNTTADLRGIHNVGNGVAWASGTQGTVLRTEDGGYVWQSCSIPPGAEKLDFRGVQAFDANTAIVMSSGPGDQSRLYKTTDGCHSWKLVITNPDKDGFWDAIYFEYRSEGWLLGDPTIETFALFASGDEGNTWTRQQNKGLNAISTQQGAFAASNSSLLSVNGLVVFGTGGVKGARIYEMTTTTVCLDDCSNQTVNRIREGKGSEWAQRELPLGSHSEASGVFSLAPKDGQIHRQLGGTLINAVGGDYTKPDVSSSTAAYSTDGGDHWSPAATPPHGYRSAVAYDSSIKTWITVGPNGTDISLDDGRNWRAVHPDAALHEAPDADRNWNALSLPYVVGPHGRIGKLDEGALKR